MHANVSLCLKHSRSEHIDTVMFTVAENENELPLFHINDPSHFVFALHVSHCVPPPHANVLVDIM